MAGSRADSMRVGVEALGERRTGEDEGEVVEALTRSLGMISDYRVARWLFEARKRWSPVYTSMLGDVFGR